MAVLAACGDGESSASLEPTTRTIYMEAIEPKGSATTDKEPFPAASLPPGGGYILKQPDGTGKWEVETYTWSLGQVIVNEGDTVKLEILGVNGTRHDSSIAGYVDSFVVERGKLTSLSFVAGKPGVFKIACTIHQPSMTSELVVLPGK
jgi:hypothetical protein